MADLPPRIRPVLTGLADECCGMLARLVVYVGGLALLAIAGLHVWDRLPADAPAQPIARLDWSVAARSYPAFAVSQPVLQDRTSSYETYRHPGGGRRDVLRWALANQKPAAELEIYRPGGETNRAGPAVAELADRMDPTGTHPLEAAGIVDTKFGPVALLRLAGDEAEEAEPCLGFMKEFDHPNVRISGWSCQGATLPARRSAIGCMLNRLMLLSSANDPKFAELFADAELKRSRCATASADWTTEAANPPLRGGL